MSRLTRACTAWNVAKIAAVGLGLFLLTLASPALAAEQILETEAGPSDVPQVAIVISWLVAVIGACAALFYAWKFYHWMVAQPEGDPNMIRIAEYVRQGARAYLNRQYRVVTGFFILIALLLAGMAYGLNVQSGWVPFAFLTGGFFSGLAGWFGMKTATMASSRTAQGAKQSLNDGLQVAFRSGAVMGLTVVGLGLLDITLWFAVLYWVVPAFGFEEMTLEQITVTMLSFGMGASIQALFARVGGGIFTKAADVGADLVGKVEAGIPEDDPRNPATIADNVGDNVGDVAGMGADLYESYAGSILATAALGVAAFAGVPQMQVMSVMLPMVLASLGIALSIAGIYLVRTEEGATQRNLLRALARGINASSLGVLVVSAILVIVMFVLPSQTADYPEGSPLARSWELMGVFGAIAAGLVSGVLIGWWTEYTTSQEYGPTKRIADQSATGPATVIIAGVAEGFYSVWVPIVVVCIAILLAFGFCTGFDFSNARTFATGLYGVAIAAVGMLSTLGITLATDAYGPIADNAGGNAEMSHQEPVVRQRTDALDSLGNTTAATGKGFAIGSAALTALALLAAYVEEVRIGLIRWGDASGEVVASADPGDATIRKISDGVFVYNPEGREATGELNNNTTWIIFPGSTGLSAEVQKIRAAGVGDEVEVDVQSLVENEFVAPMQHIETPNFNVQSATIPDFVRFYDLSIMNPKVLVGLFLGVMTAFVFCALSMKAVGRAAGYMVEEVRRQFREIPGIMEGTAEPDYGRCVDISTKAAQREMIVPALLGFAVPIVVGLLLGVSGVLGLLAGGLTSGFAVAVMMANAGGAWDNAKKYIEQGAHGGKGTEAHKATVVGDTVGDPFKDTSGPSLNILIKLMSMVSVVFAGLIVRYSLVNWF